MSIRARLTEMEKAGDVDQWMPEPGAEHRRYLFLSREVAEEMDPATWTDKGLALRYAQLAADFDRYVSEEFLPVGMDPYLKGKSAFLARIDPVETRAWSLRSMAPKPAIRVIGFFAEKDVLVLVLSELRKDLGGPGDHRWIWVREKAASWWNDNFAPERALSSEDGNDYVSGFIQV